ncbi:MAG: choice-of-anchor D domain-containing protein [Myxococcota bacterium]|jgi:hypothetical protein|nr:choice-of-anchor D domain-containing protein [Myxococcota bacterium]
MVRWSGLVLVGVVGCSDQSFHTVKDASGQNGPAIEVSPSLIEFGELGLGDSFQVETFTISSVGDEDLEVSGIELTDTTLGFSILTEDLTFTLPAGATTDIDVAFEPMAAYDQAANAIVSSNDEDDAKVPVQLVGSGVVPELAIEPDPLDMGRVYVGCDTQDYVDLINVGQEPLDIYSVEHTGDAITLLTEVELPVTLLPLESVQLTMDFAPDADAEYGGELVVTSNEPVGSRSGEQLGLGDYYAAHEEVWEIPEDPPSDIIFYVDQSCSMDDDQASLAANFSYFISSLADYSVDWQIMVTNSDDGCNNSTILTAGTADYDLMFSAAVRSGGGGSFEEAGLTVTSRAVEATDSGECNDGFLRPDAMLHIVMVSDEREQSPGVWSDYVNAVIAKKGSSSNVKMSAVAGDYPAGCGTAEAGTGYYEAVTATGGEYLSICSDWSSNVEDLAEASVNLDTFELENEPLEETIQVWVEEEERTESWEYDSDSNSVVFVAQEPEEGDTVTITYSGVPSCDE